MKARKPLDAKTETSLQTTENQNSCPGGSLDVCISLCPNQPADLFQQCVQHCMADCS